MTHPIDDPSGVENLATLLQRPSAFLTLGFLLLSGFPSAYDNGPLLVIAGPGAGKTMAIVERVVHLIAKCGVAPESILVSTFTEKAAAELVSRISDRIAEEGLKVSLK